MKLSIVSTLYRSSPYIEEFHRRVTESAQDLVGDDYEIVLVNDGSPDDSLGIAVDITKEDPNLRVVDLSRNFGHHQAMMTGLGFAQGEYVFLIDIDLEEDPELLKIFWEHLNTQECDGVDVVYGVQDARKGGWFERWSGEIYYRLLKTLLNIEHPKNISTVRLMTRRYVDALLSHKEREIVISGLWVITGFKQVAQVISKKSTSPTSYSIYRKFSHMVNTITSFSTRPLHAIFLFGIAMLFGSLVYVGYLIANRVFLSMPMAGWTSVMASIWLLGGIIISFIGVIGIYLSKVFSESKHRPFVIVKDVYGQSEKQD